MTAVPPDRRPVLASLRARLHPDDAPAVACPTCEVSYRPALTAGACPVCATPAPGLAPRRPRAFEDADDRLLALVVLGSGANVALLAALAVFVLDR